MRTFLLLSIVVGALVAACSTNVGTAPAAPATTQQPEAPTDAAAPAGDPDVEDSAGASTRAAGDSCTAADQCGSGVCEGEGCGDDTPGTCAAPHRMCTRDARSYCGCDGKTFVSSGTCPGQRYASTGACDGDPGPLGR